MRKPNVHAQLFMLRSTLSLWGGLALLALICLMWTPFALFLLALPHFEGREKLGRHIIRRGFSSYLWILQGLGWLHLSIENWDSIRASKPSIVTPNHPGLLDAVILLTHLPDCTCILKSSLLNHPLFGAGARLAGFIPNDQTHEMIRQAVKALESGQHVLMFPEGTRTEMPPISPLKMSPFVIAWKAQSDLRTVLIQNPSGFLGKHQPLFYPPPLPISMTVQPGRVFSPEKNVRALAKEVENYFASAL